MNYYIYLINSNYSSNTFIIDDKIYIYIKNKNINIKENINLKIIYENKESNIIYNNQINNIIYIGNINTIYNLEYNDIKNYIKNDNISIDYYSINNNLIDPKYINNIEYINYHWIFCGRYNPQLYFKYILKKYEDIIFKIKYSYLKYSLENNNTLLFIDDRYDPSFIYLLILFIYSVNDKWNLTIFTTIDNKQYYEDDFKKLNITGKIYIINKKFKNIYEYSKLLKNVDFWKKIPEENCLLFQYDSFSMGKFDNIFLNYNYIGALWNHKATIYECINIGNGGTSFRKTRIMEMLCEKYKNKDIKKDYPEDVYFSELLYEEKLHNCTNNIAELFSFEYIFNNNSIYGHQIYKSIDLKYLDKFIYDKIIKL